MGHSSLETNALASSHPVLPVLQLALLMHTNALAAALSLGIVATSASSLTVLQVTPVFLPSRSNTSPMGHYRLLRVYDT